MNSLPRKQGCCCKDHRSGIAAWNRPTARSHDSCSDTRSHKTLSSSPWLAFLSVFEYETRSLMTHKGSPLWCSEVLWMILLCYNRPTCAGFSANRRGAIQIVPIVHQLPTCSWSQRIFSLLCVLTVHCEPYQWLLLGRLCYVKTLSEGVRLLVLFWFLRLGPKRFGCSCMCVTSQSQHSPDYASLVIFRVFLQYTQEKLRVILDER